MQCWSCYVEGHDFQALVVWYLVEDEVMVDLKQQTHYILAKKNRDDDLW